LSFEPILLAPEEVAEEIYPFRRVWRTSWIEAVLLALVVLAIALLAGPLGLIPAALRDPLPKIGLAVLPLGLWLAISYGGERRAPQPRPALLGVLVLGALLANGVAVPLEERLFQTDRWLPAASFFGRAIGYAATIGFAGEFLKYTALRYTIWPEYIHQRLDGIAYGLAVSLGYATVLSLRVALDADVTLAATALRVASITFSQVALGAVLGFFLAELAIGRTTVFWIPSGLLLTALLSGLYYAFRGIAIVGGLSVTGTGSAPVRGLLLAFGLLALMYASVAFIVESADTRMRLQTGRRDTL
jgi:RsiW-degrading membrane proteinase PrsW (M82 family)